MSFPFIALCRRNTVLIEAVMFSDMGASFLERLREPYPLTSELQ